MIWLAVVATGSALLLVLLVLVKPLGSYIYEVFEGRPTFASRILRPLEGAIYRLCRIDPDLEMTWRGYTFSLLAFSAVSTAATYLILRVQAWLPLNPQHFGNLAPDLAWNTALSFATTTDWQFYSGESTLSYFSQMAALAWQNFVSAGIGFAVAIALIRGIVRQSSATLGNFWVDLTRSLVYVLLPLSAVFGIVLMWQGVPQNLAAYLNVHTLDGAAQTLTGGPMASQVAIEMLGGNGGGFIAANATAASENPTGFTNWFELLAMLLIPAALTHTFGLSVLKRAQGWAIFWAMAAIVIVGVVAATPFEIHGNPLIHQLGVQGANLEGKEARFGAAGTGLSLAVATNATVGAGNFTYESLLPLTSLVAMVNMQLGEVGFGGIGSGLYGILAHLLLAVFIAALMVGRTPEYLGKKLERREITFVMLAVLSFPLAILIPAAVAAIAPAGLATLGSAGTEGLSEIVYAFSSAASSNGSAFGGLGPNTFYDIAIGIAMFVGRYAAIVPTLALAGALAAKPRNDSPHGALETTSPLFVALLLATIVIVGALTFVPADALGPVIQHLQMRGGKTY